jgi:hypothetical protein
MRNTFLLSKMTNFFFKTYTVDTYSRNRIIRHVEMGFSLSAAGYNSSKRGGGLLDVCDESNTKLTLTI